MFRLFTAIDFPDHIREQISSLFFGLPSAKWVKPEQIHLTLRFIGEVDGHVFRCIADELETVKAEPFSLTLKGVGHFPPKKKPRVLWIGIEHNEKLVALRNKVESALVRAGLEPEKRKFSPHITIARFKTPNVEKISRFIAGNNLFATESFEVNEFHLYSSTLTSDGALHIRESTYPLPLTSDT